MTIVTKPKTEKKFDKPLEKPLVAADVTVSLVFEQEMGCGAMSFLPQVGLGHFRTCHGK